MTDLVERVREAMPICPACGGPITDRDEIANLSTNGDQRDYHYETCVETCDRCGTNDLIGNLVPVFERDEGGRYLCPPCAARVRMEEAE